MTNHPTLPILVVDDDEPTQRLLEAVLRRAGYATHFASQGAQAIDRLKSGSYAAIVLDLMMPHTSGADVMKWLESTGSTTPVVLCSAASPAALNRVDSPTVKAIVRKPFDVDEFTNTIRRVTSSGDRPLRALVVDDDPRARYLLRTLLDPAEVFEAESGDELEVLVGRTQPDVILLDLILPGTPGEELLIRLQDNAAMRDIPVIVVTSRATAASDPQLRTAAAVIYKGNLTRETLRQAVATVQPRNA